MANIEEYDVIIVGAGLSGIGAACHLQMKCPDHNYIILEARDCIGGTWDLFKYPGIRSDSDMYTLGYSFKPWVSDDAIADGPAILKYIKATADEYEVTEKIKFNKKVSSAAWSSEENKWTIDVQDAEAEKQYKCQFIIMCAGYYAYDSGYTPDFEGIDKYSGDLIHPQQWPEDYDYADKEVVVIGSGATAVTLVPELAKEAKSVTMLQRSPTYIMTVPQQDPIANKLRKILPAKMAYNLSRWKNISMGIFFYNLCQKWPAVMKKKLIEGVKNELGEEIFTDKDFTPDYNPWDQRLCAVPDSDLFLSIKAGTSKVVTDHIDQFTSDGIQLKSGDHLPADLIITATGLRMQFIGGMKIIIDQKEVNIPSLFTYRGMMFSGVPNLASMFGYTNASWTLKCDLSCSFVCRILNSMSKKNQQSVTAIPPADIKETQLIDLASGYVSRAAHELPKQGDKRPWRLFQNYIKDIFNLKYSSLNDGSLNFE